MNEQAWEACYGDCPRFDESQAYQSSEYGRASAYFCALKARLEVLVGCEHSVLLDAMLESSWEMAEMECQYYYAKGYAAGALTMIGGEG